MRERAKIEWYFCGIPNRGISGFLRDENVGILGFVRYKSPIFYPEKSQNHGIFNPAKIPGFNPIPEIEISRDFSRFFRSVFREFSQFSLPKTGKNEEFHPLNAQFSRDFNQHRVRKTNFFHIFAGTVLKT